MVAGWVCGRGGKVTWGVITELSGNRSICQQVSIAKVHNSKGYFRGRLQGGHFRDTSGSLQEKQGCTDSLLQSVEDIGEWKAGFGELAQQPRTVQYFSRHEMCMKSEESELILHVVSHRTNGLGDLGYRMTFPASFRSSWGSPGTYLPVAEGGEQQQPRSC